MRLSSLILFGFVTLFSFAGTSLGETEKAIEEPPATFFPEHEPIPYFERYQPSFFLLGKPYTKVQISFKVQALRKIPIYFGYTQVMAWDLFKPSSPFREIDFSPEFFYRTDVANEHRTFIDMSPFQHESNGKADVDSRSWNRAYVRIFQTRDIAPGAFDRRIWWSAKVWIPYGTKDAQSKILPKFRGLWEVQLAMSDLFGNLFEVNELMLRIYGGGASHVNPFRGGQELTYREKTTARKFLLPLYIQIFQGYGENLQEAEYRHWGFRAGIGF